MTVIAFLLVCLFILNPGVTTKLMVAMWAVVKRNWGEFLSKLTPKPKVKVEPKDKE